MWYWLPQFSPFYIAQMTDNFIVIMCAEFLFFKSDVDLITCLL